MRSVVREESALEAPETRRLLTQARDAAHRIEEARTQMARAATQRRDAVSALRDRGLSYGEIARALGCSRSAIQSLLRTDPK